MPGQILSCPQVLSGRWVGDDRGFFRVLTARYSWERQLLPGETAQPEALQKSPAKTQSVCWGLVFCFLFGKDRCFLLLLETVSK